ncbi:unnamed protein product [Rotaria socialis]|uniref:Uncharacterized protein n=1 Tax=Rotaria socialis TaxID=392032 RepID=A0A821EDD5_9BILA|nr:unnamed protein product [Rotaria socialis]CAF4633545.1 unnamed protein product [Rotaria socialis]CAF4810053.1 unnamed protein product [Rotaria socialis]
MINGASDTESKQHDFQRLDSDNTSNNERIQLYSKKLEQANLFGEQIQKSLQNSHSVQVEKRIENLSSEQAQQITENLHIEQVQKTIEKSVDHDRISIKISKQNEMDIDLKEKASSLILRGIGVSIASFTHFYPIGIHKTLILCAQLIKCPGVHSITAMQACGFRYTNVRDTVRCDHCKLEISDWTKEMIPFGVHAELSPECTFVRSMKPPNTEFVTCSTPPKLTNIVRTNLDSLEKEKPSKPLTIETTKNGSFSWMHTEVKAVKVIRQETFSNWPSETPYTGSQMINAGYFYCNAGDRVTCIYCHLTCQQWKSNSEEPWEVHKTMSPKCPFVIAEMARREALTISTVNENTAINVLSETIDIADTLPFSEVAITETCNATYRNISQRYESFSTWPMGASPTVKDLVDAGFFYAGTNTTVICFSCNGSLEKWEANSNPIIEHVTWFPYCKYIKEVCGGDPYRELPESVRITNEGTKVNHSIITETSSSVALLTTEESTLSCCATARLDLPMCQTFLEKHFELPIIKRCFEDQLRLKHNDFKSYGHAYMACLILQIQINLIKRSKESITVPTIKVRQDGQREEAGHVATSSASIDPLMTSGVETNTSSQVFKNDSNRKRGLEVDSEETKEDDTNGDVAVLQPTERSISTKNNPCVLCLNEKKSLACIGNGYSAACNLCALLLELSPKCERQL